MANKKLSAEDLAALKLKYYELAQKGILLESEKKLLAEQKVLNHPSQLEVVADELVSDGGAPTYGVENAFPNISFDSPVGIYHAGDGMNRLFVVEQPGTIEVFDNDPGVISTETFLDIRDIVNDNGDEEGLLGLAFHPNYGTNGYFYVIIRILYLEEL